ncbi:hypothetical protein CANCADRAFT_30753 [Tortispora caseinolytica NRRL Y-17796]|uniref:Ribosomal protein L35Ae n=1 Tax=Tortispora caseinolytica NRRL Y-17796 TaxID=767744 RepID=A0A1E4TLY8_9ASCO|nr:hypothetical protein CANCADRAFT_30753 [Tortispora caseinolytica NRRL Y-17796]
MSEPKLYVSGKHLSYRRGKSLQYPNVSLLRLDGVSSAEEAQFYLGKRVVFIYRTKGSSGSRVKFIWGRIARTHGKSGVVRARFRSNLPPVSFGAKVRVMLYPSNI